MFLRELVVGFILVYWLVTLTLANVFGISILYNYWRDKN